MSRDLLIKVNLVFGTEDKEEVYKILEKEKLENVFNKREWGLGWIRIL